jgi:DNA-directed RNA polymerase specialized sigma24 family protein
LNDDFSKLSNEGFRQICVFSLIGENLFQLSRIYLKAVNFKIDLEDAEAYLYSDLTPHIKKFLVDYPNIPPKSRRNSLFGHMISVIRTRLRKTAFKQYIDQTEYQPSFDTENGLSSDDIELVNEKTSFSQIYFLSDDSSVHDEKITEQHRLLEHVRPLFRTKTMDCLRLRVINNYSTTQIADVMGDDRIAVYRRLRTARETIAALAQDDLQDFAANLIVQD